MNPPLNYSASGLIATESYEGCSLTPYQDSAGNWTNGIGNTHNVDPSVTITHEQALADLSSNIQTSVDAVNRLVTTNLNQNEFDALVDFVYNVGEGNFARSTLLLDINKGLLALAAQQFPAWDKSSGQYVAGLWHRRIAEETTFNTPVIINGDSSA